MSFPSSNTAAAGRTGQGRYRPWIVLAAATGINMTMGINYSWSVIKKALVADWQWTNVEASLPYTMYSVAFAIAMVFAGRLQDRFGPRRVATFGGLVLGVGLVAASLASDPLTMALAYGVSGFANSFCYSTTAPSAMKWFPLRRKGLVAGMVIGGTGLAAAYFSPITNALLAAFGIHRAFLYLGCTSLVILSLSQFLSTPPAPAARPEVGRPDARPDREIHWTGMVRERRFYLLWLMYLFSSASGLMIMAHIASIALRQAGWADGFYLVMVFALLNASGRALAGYTSDRFGRPAILLAGFGLQIVNLLAFAFYATPVSLMVGVAVTGLTYGASFALFPLMTADYYGLRNFGGNYGLMFTGWGTAGIVGPLLGGWVADLTGGYVAAYLASAVLLSLGVVLLFMLRRCGPSRMADHVA